MSLYPLAIHGEPQAGDYEAIVAAKVSLGLPYKVTPVVAQPGGPVRVLALRSAPPFLCDFRGTTDPAADPELADKLAWVLGETDDDPKASLVLDQLRAILGPEVKEVTDEYFD